MSNCLVKWQAFDTYRNGYIRKETEFRNVTLACEDGQEMKAHKVILSSGSLFFREILTKMRHTEPFIFLYGIQKCDLENIIEFIYTGEVCIDENGIGQFIEIAKVFKIPGLGDLEYISTVKNGIVTKESEIEEEKNSSKSKFDNEVVDLHDDNSQEDLDINSENINVIEREECKVNTSENETQFVEENEIGGIFSSLTDELHTRRDDLMDKVDGLWECKQCKKTFVRQNHFNTHADTHFKDGENVCALCNKTLGTKDSLRKHISYVHSKASSMCSRCGKSGMNRNQHRNHVYQAKLKGKCPKEKSNIKIEM